MNQNSGSLVSTSDFNQNSGSSIGANKLNQNSGSSIGTNIVNQNSGSSIKTNNFNQNTGSSIGASNFNQNSGSYFGTNSFNQNSGSSIESNSFNQNSASSIGTNNFNQNIGLNTFTQNTGDAIEDSYYPTNNGFNSVEPNVVKSVYFHRAPEEEQHSRPQQFTALPPRINYKIVFIKTDSKNAQPTVNKHYLPPPVQDEQKTLIYVLSKTPQEINYEQQTVLPAAPIHKPEVFFIKYKDEKAAQNQGHYAHEINQNFHSHEY